MRLDSLVIISLLVSPQLVNLFQASYSLSKIGNKLLLLLTVVKKEKFKRSVQWVLLLYIMHAISSKQSKGLFIQDSIFYIVARKRSHFVRLVSPFRLSLQVFVKRIPKYLFLACFEDFLLEINLLICVFYCFMC
jgi:hypothetical protein